ncbi:MAG: MucB/RseB C-terminal domain-containing protein [Gammaproteobacteria bacterium]|nr:MucB/RseB C-terminal domain-containing protein [Gammaproteobacteria bacterium]
MRLVVFLTSLVLFSYAGAEQNAAPALSFLNKMGSAIKDLNYHGTLVYLHGGQVESLKLVHKQDKSGEIQRLVHLSGEAREVIRNNEIVTCYMPDTRSVVVGERRFNNHLLSRLTRNFGDFEGQYEFVVDGKGRIAERESTVVLIRPKDGFRYGYRFWIDDDSGLLLKSDLLATDGSVLEQLMFVELAVVDRIPDAMLQPAVNGESYTWHNGRGKRADQQIEQETNSWRIARMPDGFIVTDRSKQKIPNRNQPVDYMMVSDGLASISIYIEQYSEQDHGLLGASSMGAVNVFGSLLANYHVTVVGEVPQQTVQMIAESISNQ